MKISTAEKLQRLISIVAWISDQDGPTLDEVCQRFAIGRAELVAQLDMASLVGDGSDEYGDMPIELFYEDDRVFVYLSAFERPLRLTPAQGLALLTAGAGLLDLEGADRQGPLGRAVDKVAAVLGMDPEEVVDIDLGEADPATLDLLRSAVASARPVAIEYWSAGRDHHTSRTIEPWRVFNEAGAWYVQAWCRSADAERIFRVDRMREVALADGTFTAPDPLPPTEAYRAGADDPRIVLDLDAEVHWVAATHPVDRVEPRPDGVLRVTMPAGAPAFLARLLLALGPHATVVEAGDRSHGTEIVADAARRILARYDGGARPDRGERPPGER